MSYIGKTPTSVPLTSSDITDSIISLPKLTDGTDGNLISYDASGNPVAVATGNDGQVLTSAGVGAPPVFETLPAGGITEADQWRLTSSLTGQNVDITANLERVDNSSATYIGTGMSESSGIFTFPSTGKWLVQLQASVNISSGDDGYAEVDIMVTTNNSSYEEVARTTNGVNDSAGASNGSFTQYILDVTDTSQVKVKFHTNSFSGSTSLMGNTSRTITGFFFIRLGDT